VLPCVVIFSRYSRRAAECRQVMRIPSPQLLLFPSLTNRDARNSFRPPHLRAVSARRIRSLVPSETDGYENCQVTSFRPKIFLRSGLPTLALSPLPATLMTRSASVADKRLTVILNPLDATRSKIWGGYILQSKYLLSLSVCRRFGASLHPESGCGTFRSKLHPAGGAEIPTMPGRFDVSSLPSSRNFISPSLVPISKNRRCAGQEASSYVRP